MDKEMENREKKNIRKYFHHLRIRMSLKKTQTTLTVKEKFMHYAT